ncbi:MULTISPECIES: acetyltransferase [Geobacillus]|jgi:acetyltransferase EpsM|uniref:acetyltransferase n=1 Tax=Geobacillus TaxID=129337 RepID=UPI0008460E91|nr:MULTISPECIES: acetyltransferase [Geobacillus]AOL35913.1 acetyltransferase [Geobacillus thermoleovorans]PJW13255.1 acetyltransferase [Geobacillus sp. Manikaran-105]
MNPIVVIGEGGHSKVIQDIIFAVGGYQIIAILDDKYKDVYNRDGVLYGPISVVLSIINRDRNTKLIIAIGNNQVRAEIVKRIGVDNKKFATLIHPSAIISPSARIGEGTVIMPNCVVNANAEIGKHVIINTGAIVEHDNRIGDYAHISPNATLTGNVAVGEGTHIGASATIIPGIKVGKWSVIGAGSTVIRDIPDFKKAVGCPTRLLD